MSFKLQSSDGVIFSVDAAAVKQMVTIQTMIDLEDEDSDEITPVPTVKGKVLEKVIQWIEYHKIDHKKKEKIAWYRQYFDIELRKIFEIFIAADYLEVESLLNESWCNIPINNKWVDVEEAANNFHDPKILALLVAYERQHGSEVMVTIFDNKHIKYFDIEVR